VSAGIFSLGGPISAVAAVGGHRPPRQGLAFLVGIPGPAAPPALDSGPWTLCLEGILGVILHLRNGARGQKKTDLQNVFCTCSLPFSHFSPSASESHASTPNDPKTFVKLNQSSIEKIQIMP